MDNYKHISFSKRWEIKPECAYMLGECEAYVAALTNIPLSPSVREKLYNVSLIKGAQATTAIEGNTLTEDEITKIKEGWHLPASREYQQIEVENVINALNEILHEVTEEKKIHIITPELIKEFHHKIGKNLGKHLDAIPGKFREDSRVVGRYLSPKYKQVPQLIDKLCEWLKKEFHYEKGQKFQEIIIQAIVAHVYIEWIHPFGDGNGRTGRLLEFYILLRAQIPSIVSHILSNFYNQTRQEYYRQFDNARAKQDLTEFLEYAIQGFRDGLKENLKILQGNQFSIFWHNHIYDVFANLQYTKREVFKRKRELILAMPVNKKFTVDEIQLLSPQIAKKYATVTRATVLRDLKELLELKLLLKEGNKYIANTKSLKPMIF